MTAEHYAVSNHALEKGLTRAIDSLAPGEVLLTHPANSTVQHIGATATIMCNETYREGRRNAMSGIWFGDITLRSESGHEHTQPIAIKPLGRAWKVGEELLLADTLNTLSTRHRPHVSGTPFTYVPLGAYRDPQTSNYCALTRFEQGVESFDNIFSESDGETLTGDHRFALANAAETLIFLHENGFVHRDYQVKNTAADTIGARLIDISSVKKMRQFTVPDLDAYIENLREYISSLRPYVQSSSENAATVDEYFLDLYRQNTKEIFPRQFDAAVDFKLASIDTRTLLTRS